MLLVDYGRAITGVLYKRAFFWESPNIIKDSFWLGIRLVVDSSFPIGK